MSESDVEKGELSIEENELGVLAPFDAAGKELRAVSGERDEEAACGLGIELREVNYKTERRGGHSVSVVLKTWRVKDDALALYLRGDDDLVFRVLLFPQDGVYCRLSGKTADVQSVALGSTLSVEIEEQNGWPRLVKAALEEGKLIDEEAPSREAPSQEKASQTSVPKRPSEARPSEARPSEARPSEARPSEGQRAQGTRAKKRGCESIFVRRGVWTYSRGGTIRGLQFIRSGRVSEAVIMAAWRQQAAWALREDYQAAEISDMLGVSEGAVESYLRSARDLVKAGREPGSRGHMELRASDVKTFVLLKLEENAHRDSELPQEALKRTVYAKASAEASSQMEGGRGKRHLFLCPGTETRETCRPGDTRLGRLEEKPRVSTGLLDREKSPIFEGDRVRADSSMPVLRVWWSRRHLRWQAGDNFSLAELDAIAREHFGRGGLECISK